MRRRNQLRWSASVLLAFVGALHAAHAQENTLIEEVVTAVQSQESGVHFIRFSAKGSQESFNAAARTFTPVGEAALTATYEAMPGKRVRLNVTRDLSVWVNAPAPFLLRSFDVAYDGSIGTLYLSTVGDPAEPSTVSRGSIMPSRPPELDRVEDKDAWRASIFGWVDDTSENRVPFSRYLASAAKRGDLAIVKKSTNSGTTIYEISVKNNFGHTTFFLDASRSCAIRKIECFYFKKSPAGSIKPVVEFLHLRKIIEEITKTREGIYYPTHVVAETYFPDDHGDAMDNKTVTDIDHVEINPADIAEHFFSVEFPPNTVVSRGTPTIKTFVHNDAQ